MSPKIVYQLARFADHYKNAIKDYSQSCVVRIFFKHFHDRFVLEGRIPKHSMLL